MTDETIDLSYKISNYICPVCKARGMQFLMERMGNHYICPICRSSCYHGEMDYRNIVSMIEKSFEDDYSLNNLLSPHPNCSYLNNILIEIRNSIQCGFYLSALTTLGVYLELLVKEIYFAQYGERLRLELGPSIKKIQSLIDSNEYDKLMALKDKLRNPVIHGNFSEILSETYIKEEIPKQPIDDIHSLDRLLNEGGHTYYINAADIPTIAFCTSYNSFFKTMAINAFKEVYDIAFILSFKHLLGPYHSPDYLNSSVRRYTPDEFEKMNKEKNRECITIETEKHIITTSDGIRRLLDNDSKQ